MTDKTEVQETYSYCLFKIKQEPISTPTHSLPYSWHPFCCCFWRPQRSDKMLHPRDKKHFRRQTIHPKDRIVNNFDSLSTDTVKNRWFCLSANKATTSDCQSSFLFPSPVLQQNLGF